MTSEDALAPMSVITLSLPDKDMVDAEPSYMVIRLLLPEADTLTPTFEKKKLRRLLEPDIDALIGVLVVDRMPALFLEPLTETLVVCDDIELHTLLPEDDTLREDPEYTGMLSARNSERVAPDDGASNSAHSDPPADNTDPNGAAVVLVAKTTAKLVSYPA